MRRVFVLISRSYTRHIVTDECLRAIHNLLIIFVGKDDDDSVDVWIFWTMNQNSWSKKSKYSKNYFVFFKLESIGAHGDGREEAREVKTKECHTVCGLKRRKPIRVPASRACCPVCRSSGGSFSTLLCVAGKCFFYFVEGLKYFLLNGLWNCRVSHQCEVNNGCFVVVIAKHILV